MMMEEIELLVMMEASPTPLGSLAHGEELLVVVESAGPIVAILVSPISCRSTYSLMGNRGGWPRCHGGGRAHAGCYFSCQCRDAMMHIGGGGTSTPTLLHR